MITEWITPQATELTIEEVAELAKIDLVCAGTSASSAMDDHR